MDTVIHISMYTHQLQLGEIASLPGRSEMGHDGLNGLFIGHLGCG
jgi:hypothetical protein